MAMRSPSKRPLAFIAEYQFGDENILTATHHEEVRLKNEKRVRNAQSILKLEGLTIGGETSPTHNLKRIQQEHDRHGEIEQHNLILLDRLERIHRHLPKQFDVSHHSEAVQNAPRASNAGLRRRQQEKIDEENKRMKRRLDKVKGPFGLKKLATEAEKHEYFSEQLSKVARRRKARDACMRLTDLSAAKAVRLIEPDQFYVYDYGLSHFGDDDDDEDDHDNERKFRASYKLPPLMRPPQAAKKYTKHPHGSRASPTLTNTQKSISAAELLGAIK